MDNFKNDLVNLLLNDENVVNISEETSVAFRRVATWNCPWVSLAFQNTETQKSVAFVFQDSLDFKDNKLNTIISTLQEYDSCVVCIHIKDITEAEDIISEIINLNLNDLSIGIVVYDNKYKYNVQRQAIIQKKNSTMRSKSEMKSYWLWWRDASHSEIAILLELFEKYDNLIGDIYTKKVYPEFYEMMISGKTLQWDGTPRKKSYSESCYKAEKQNYKIPLAQLGLINRESCHITDKGRKFLNVSRKYGTNSKEYLLYLSKLILLDGKHLDLIKDVEEFQKNQSEFIPEQSSEFFILFDSYMENKHSLGTRKPSAIKTGAKKSYVRDEPKLWNKLGILYSSGKSRYYVAYKGIQFNWDRINEILLSAVE